MEEEEKEKTEKGKRREMGGRERGPRRRTGGRSNEETKKNDSNCSRLLLSLFLSSFFLFSSLFSEALIFNDILGHTKVPLMHGHYNMLLLSFSLSVHYKGRVHACTSRAILPAAAFSIGQRVPSSHSPPIPFLFHPFSTHHRSELTSHRKSRAVSWKRNILYINL